MGISNEDTARIYAQRQNTTILTKLLTYAKNKKTLLTDEVREALIEIRNIPWDQFPVTRVGYALQNYPGVRRVLMNSMLNIEFVGKYLVMLDKPKVETEHIEITISNYSGDVKDIESATFNLKTNLADKKTTDIPWRELALEYGYTAGSGTFSRAIKGRRWARTSFVKDLIKQRYLESRMVLKSLLQ